MDEHYRRVRVSVACAVVVRVALVVRCREVLALAALVAMGHPWWWPINGVLIKEKGQGWDYSSEMFSGPHATLYGTVAVLTAIICFGTQCVFIKSKQILQSGIDSFVVISYFSLGIFLCGILFFCLMAPM